MKVLITGGAGFLGTRLAHTLLQAGTLRGQAITQLMLADLVAPRDTALLADARVRHHAGDLLANIPTLMAERWDAVFHLASAVSGECEANFDLGLHANLDTTRSLLDACRAQTLGGEPAPLFFFSSSVAVFGSDAALPLPAVVRDDTLPTPQSSYGIHKFVCEQLVADYTRKGFIDGRAARLMTVSVRPGRPNGAASGFLSGLFREPLAGQASACPVDLDTRVALSSPANTVAGIVAVAEASREAFGGRTAINLPALTVSVREMLAALEDLTGPEVMRLVTHVPDAAIAGIVSAWPARFESARAPRLGLLADASFTNVLQQYVQDHPDAVSHPEARARLGLSARA
ncbi:D-erythronate dehydrogenase [Hydrogenophaga sp.]|uniref:D-erythronate dehydrogenase n=1 Tax=Hydrogenophaga sp. TaxID=1904254 RepID=UPI002731FB04|nr:D-erythronate dehydrogenase [Hydrogenophaga sp.]MDP2018082.1 NAD-dependent epimerase/dehydratase family protein [Hydrogenophaga sp.]MDP3165516.1 NAD-dependent epimerase/dehydratase family protein [Hydrogenophaga sp.]MDP3812666.1 NAD-dependent epimerase/dehydratase family protein [Hydrogenophaga sp.]